MDNVRPLRPKKKPPKPRRDRRTVRRIIIAVIVAVVVLVLAFGSRLLGMYVDWLWFGEIGFRGVYWTRIWSQLLLGLAAFVAFFVVIWVNVELARRLAPDFRADVDGTLLEPRSPRVRRWVGIGGVAICVVVAFIAAVPSSSAWQTVLLYLNQAPWGERDAQFGRDISFFVFSMPFWQGVLGFVTAALIAALVLAAIVHLIMGGIEIRQKAGATTERDAGQSPFARVQQSPQIPQVDVKLAGRAVAHLSVLLAAVFVVVGIGQLFKAWDLVYSTAGAIYGAAYTDVVVRLPMARVTMVIAFILAGALVWNAVRRRQWWWGPAAVAVWVVALILLRGIVPAVYQSLIVNPNQLSKEREYIGRNLDATRQAYGLESIVQRPFETKATLTARDLRENQPTLRNIRLWDPNTLVTSYRQLQELRPYYVFLDADVDRYTVNGSYRQTMLSARELNIDGLPQQAQTWVNQHITYTHGFGVAMSAVNQVTADGSPDFLVQDIPPVSSAPDLEIEQPRIYFGERGTEYSLVNTTEAEFDYPGSAGDVYTDGYDGTGGVPISPVLNRLAFAARYGTIKFFTTSAITDDSRIIFRNDIRERIEATAPFLALDTDPYMTIADGRLWWIQDAYTVTERYPYSTPEAGLNYIRNSVKVVVDAYNGSMTFYVWDEEDPILRTYRDLYPELFTPKSEVPKALLEHVRYPEGMFDIQAQVWTTYHVDGPEILYNKGDQWMIPEGVSLDGGGPMQAYYVIMRLPGEEKEEFLLMIPFVPNGRQNMISWLGARSDVPEYGTALNYLFSKSTTVFGPNQVESIINQDPEISAQRTLWGQQGSEVILGNLLVVPIEDSLLYVQPLYLQSNETQLPQLQRVIVFYRPPTLGNDAGEGEQVVAMRPTLTEALVAAFGESLDPGPEQGEEGTGGGEAGGGTGGQTGGTGGLSAEARALIARANSEFEAAQQALQAGDFAEYGRRIDALEQALTDLQRLRQQ
jgi:uncharacterized membrane protein (UPF0182 family)